MLGKPDRAKAGSQLRADTVRLVIVMHLQYIGPKEFTHGRQ
jgi:hypothetical protein